MAIFSEREIKLIVAGTGAAALIAIVIVAIVSLPQGRAARLVSETNPEKTLSVTELEIPHEYLQIGGPELHVYRERLQRWNIELIERFWVDPREIEIEILAVQNDELLRELFDKVE